MDKMIPESENTAPESMNIDDIIAELNEQRASIVSEFSVEIVQEQQKDDSEFPADDIQEEPVQPDEVPAAQEKSEDTLPRVSHDHRFDDDDDDEADELAFELERKHAKRRRLKISLTVIAVIVFVIAAAGISLNFIFTPEKTVDAFVSALETADVAKLRQVAEIEGGRSSELTQRNTAPMFELYSESESFRAEIDACLQEDIAAVKRGEEPKYGGIVDIKVSNFILFRLYRVCIAKAEAVVYTNFNGAKVSISDMTQVAYASKGYEYNAYGYTVSDDYFDFVESRAVFKDVLPGNYDVHVEYLSTFGETFEAEGTFAFENENIEFTLDVEFETVEIVNSTDFAVSVMMDGTEVQAVESGATYKMFPLTAGRNITVSCDSGDGIASEKTITAGESECVELAFAALTVDNSDNGAAVDVYLNGKRIGAVDGYAEPLRIYPLNIGDKVEFLPSETKYQALVMPLAVEVTDYEQSYELFFELKSEIYSGVDQIVFNDITESFRLINEDHSKEELTELVLEYKTLAEMIDYTYNEETGMYSTLTDPQITIDLASDTRAYFAHDAINMYVEANIVFEVGYHEENKQPAEYIAKDITLSYTLLYADGKWSFPEMTGEH